MQPKSSGTIITPAFPLRRIECDLQEEGNLGFESADIYQRSIEEVEGAEHGNGWAIGFVCLLVIIAAIAGLIFFALMLINWLA